MIDRIAAAALAIVAAVLVVHGVQRLERIERDNDALARDVAGLRVLNELRADEIELLALALDAHRVVSLPVLSAIEAGEPVRCAWRLMPESSKTWLRDTAEIACSRVEPCALTRSGPINLHGQEATP